MPKKTVDRRVRKTKKQLRQALTELMKEKSIKNITVRELSEMADINRGTFYIHYKDVFDMLEQIENEMFEGFNETINAYKPDEILQNPAAMLADIFSFLGENADICISLLGKNGDIAFLDKLKGVVKYKFLHEWIKDKKKLPDFEYLYSFIISGCIGLMQCWLETGMKEAPCEMAGLVNKILLKDMMVMR